MKYPKDKLIEAELSLIQVSHNVVTDNILLDLLWEKFWKDLLDGNLCASDQLPYIVGTYDSIKIINEYWVKWMKVRGYIHDMIPTN